MSFTSWLRSMRPLRHRANHATRPTRHHKTRKAPTTRLFLEPLEDRTLLSAGFLLSNTGPGTVGPLPAISAPDLSPGPLSPSYGDFYVTGYFTGTVQFGSTTLTSSTGVDSWDTYVAKVAPDGTYQWAVKLEQSGGTGGNTNWDGIALDPTNGDVYVTGNFGDTATFVTQTQGTQTLTSNGGTDILIAKLDPSGNIDWVQHAGGANNDWGMKVAVDNKGDVYLTSLYSVQGNSASATFGMAGRDPGVTTLQAAAGSGLGSIALSELNTDGYWLGTERLFDTAGQLGGLAVDTNGYVYVSGSISSQSFTTFLNAYSPNAPITGPTTDPPTVWHDDNLGTNGFNAGWGLTTHQDPTGATWVYVVGNGGNIQEVDAKTGQIVQVNEALGAPNNGVIARAVAVDASGDIYIAGEFGGTVNFDPGTGRSAYMTSSANGGYAPFLVKLDRTGNFLSAWQLGSGNPQDGNYASGLALDPGGTPYTVGSFIKTSTFDTGDQSVPPPNNTLTSQGSASLFIDKTSQDNGTIFGQVFNSRNSSGIPNVTVNLLGSSNNYTTTTDSQGYYHFTDVAPSPVPYTVNQALNPAFGSFTITQTPSPVTVTNPVTNPPVGPYELGNFVDDPGALTPLPYTSTDVPQKIGNRSGQGVTSTLPPVSVSYPIYGLYVTISATQGAAAFELVAPDGTIAQVGPGINIPVTGLDYHNTYGTWTLHMYNRSSTNSPSTLTAWSLTFMVPGSPVPLPPQIGSFMASSNPVKTGTSMTLSVGGVTDPLGGTITQVAIYQDSVNDGTLQTGDKLLGEAVLTNGVWTFSGVRPTDTSVTGTYDPSKGTGTWTFISSSAFGLTAGTYKLFAQATDNYGNLGDPVALTLTVTR